MKLRVGAATDIGQARQRNEDSYLVAHPLYVIADGMGGHRGGAEASSLAVEVMSGMKEPGPDRLEDLVHRANRVVFEKQASDRSLSGMGTTLTAVLADDSTVHLAHVGDSRAYLLRDGELRRLTEDHTLVQRMLREGKISREEAETHPQRNIMTRAVGVDEDVDVDHESIDVREGDRILLCTDGLTGMMREESVKEILEGHGDPQEAAEALVDSANRAGGLDNITVVVIDFAPGHGVENLEGGAVGSAPEPRQTNSANRPAPIAEAVPDITGVIEPVPAERPRRRWRRPLVWAAVVILVIVAGLVAGKFYVDRQWYVGVQNGHVTVFRGLPTDVLGYDLSHSVQETDVSASKAMQLAPYRNLDNGITADSEEAAQAIVDHMREDLLAQQRERHHKNPGGTG